MVADSIMMDANAKVLNDGTNTNSYARCVVCGGEANIVTIANLRRSHCSYCHHSQRLDTENYDYRQIVNMGISGTSLERLESQCDFILPFIKADSCALELGCAAGSLAYLLMQKQRFKTYDGVEISPAHVEAKKVMNTVFQAPIIELLATETVKSGMYDLVIASHYLEHTSDIHAEIRAMKDCLSETGILFIEVPNGSGNIFLPYDDNRTHRHFFTVSSLARLLSNQGLSIVAAQTGARLDARYSDSLRIVAKRFQLDNLPAPKLLSAHPLVAKEDKVVVWGTGKMVDEILVHFFDFAKIAFFVDSDSQKHGKTCFGLPIRNPNVLPEHKDMLVLINSIEFEEAIRSQIDKLYKTSELRVIGVGELMSEPC